MRRLGATGAPWRDLAVAAALALAAWLGPTLAVREAARARLNLGPNDVEYVTGFRPDWERDGRTVFHWTTRSATLALPVGLAGDGFRLRLRARRYFSDPAQVTVVALGRTVARFDFADTPGSTYRVVELPLPPLTLDPPATLLLDVASENPRPLGLALDWVELERASGSSRFVLPHGLILSCLVAVLAAFAVPRLAGLSRMAASSGAAAVLVGACVGVARDPVAAERILRLGSPLFAGGGLLALLLVSWRRLASPLGIDTSRVAGALAALVLAALAVRLVLLLHPEFFYPDVRVHGLFVWQLDKDGPLAFLREFTANQFRHSLGLQKENGHWYAFPYPPLFYFAAWPFVRLAGYRPETAAALLAALANALETLLVFAIARRLGQREGVALAAAAAVPLLPIFSARLLLAYFPAILGHAVDTLVILAVLVLRPRLPSVRVVLGLATLVALALLTYTQSLLNLALLLPLALVMDVVRDRTPEARRRQLGFAAAGLLGALLSGVVFYGRYVPIVADMRRGVPMPEERILLEKQAQEREAAAEEADDPYAGPGIRPWRGVQRAASRLRIFYGLFAPLVVAGVALVIAGAAGFERGFALAWALTYLLLNLAAGGLPGPNLVRYNKDIEAVAPLCCAGLAALGAWLWERGLVGRLAAVGLGAGFLGFGASRALHLLGERLALFR